MRLRGTWVASAFAIGAVGGALALSLASHGVAHSARRAERRAALPSGTVVTFGGGAWCWFQDPRVVQVGGPLGRTYAGWIARNGDITVGSFDPLLGRTRTHVVGHWIHDDHASPVLLVEPSHRLTVFWAVHNGRSVRYRTTVRPLDIRSWGPVGQLGRNPPRSLGITYPNPVMVPVERDRLYMFWRGPDWGTDYLTRTGGRWSNPRELILPDPGQRPYLKVAGNGYDRVALAYNDAHPGETSSDVYFMEYRHGSLWTAGGRWIRRIDSGPATPSQGELVYDGRATGIPSWVWDVSFDSHQRPVIVYATFPSVHNHEYWYARFDGRRWVSHMLTFAGGSISPTTSEVYYSGGIALDHSDPSTVYLSRKVGRWFRLERWITRDAGPHLGKAGCGARSGRSGPSRCPSGSRWRTDPRDVDVRPLRRLHQLQHIDLVPDEIGLGCAFGRERAAVGRGPLWGGPLSGAGGRCGAGRCGAGKRNSRRAGPHEWAVCPRWAGKRNSRRV